MYRDTFLGSKCWMKLVTLKESEYPFFRPCGVLMSSNQDNIFFVTFAAFAAADIQRVGSPIPSSNCPHAEVSLSKTLNLNCSQWG